MICINSIRYNYVLIPFVIIWQYYLLKQIIYQNLYKLYAKIKREDYWHKKTRAKTVENLGRKTLRDYN